MTGLTDSATPRICAYFSVGRNYLKVLRAIRAEEPNARLCAMVPAGYPVSEAEASVADEIIETQLARYSAWNVPACLRLVRQLRAGRYDVFVVMFDSTELQVLSSLAGARRRSYCTMDGRLVPLTAPIPRVLAGAVARTVRGRLAYALLWLAVRVLRVRGQKETPKLDA